jgi:nucleoid DNA-binding protein
MRAQHSTASLISHVMRSTGLTQEQAGAAIRQTLHFITTCVCTGRGIHLHEFGSFLPYERKARVTRLVSPGSHQECLIHHPNARYVRFKPAPCLKQCVKNSSTNPNPSHV